ncbi:MAG: amino acid ABC transporter permease [Bauldia sp.]|nr:amino acid ABC transporter permease [Bauldia sp.]
MAPRNFVRTEIIPAQPPPAGTLGPLAWLRAHLFSTPANAAITILAVLFLAWTIPPLIRWAFVDAVWTGENREACVGAGACWAFVRAKFDLFMYGQYPPAQHWRVNVVGLLFVAGLVPMAIPAIPGKRWTVLYLLVVFPVAAFILLRGGMFGLTDVPTTRWGGLLVTLVVAVTGIVIAFPLGVLLALARRSRLPLIRVLATGLIEIWRGVPLVTVLFMASVMLPIFLPSGVTIDKLLRAIIGIGVFYSAYMAEVIRGGLQSIPRGQYEGAMALGLSGLQRTWLVVLPQALTISIPGIVNTIIALFKDTSLVLIIALYDLLGMIQSATNDSNWAVAQVPASGYAFAAVIYWALCFSMSRYSLFIERRRAAGRPR